MNKESLLYRPNFTLDCCGQLCPVPIIMTEEKIGDLKKHEVLEVIFTDPGATPDLTAWCKASGHTLLGILDGDLKSFAYIKRK